MSKSVLIVSFSMPPSPDIGGRRWVKFAKYLKLNGHKVKIIAAEENLPGESPWVKDGNELRNEIIFLKSSYPKYLGIRPVSFKEKLFYKLSLIYAKLVSKGNYYDKSNYWERQLLRCIIETIKKHSIKNVICTIPPFRMAYFILDLKKSFPEVNFIVDYRDPWSNNKTSFGFTSLSIKRYEYERVLEEKVIKGFDLITAVSSEMGEYFKQVLGEKCYSEKFVQLSNGFDRQDFGKINLGLKSLEPKNKITIVFAGTFYDKAVYILKKLMLLVTETELKYPMYKYNLNFIFIGTVPASLTPWFLKYNANFTFLGKKSLIETYTLIGESDFCSLFLTDDLNYSFSTKFYEYIAFKKPILSFSKEKGANAKFIEDNQLGWGIDFTNMENYVKSLMSGSISKDFKSKLDINEFDVSHLVNKVEAILID